MTDRIVYLNSELFYYKEGGGSKTILLFHGSGQDHRAFTRWMDVFEKDYTIYLFDLFFHGNSIWKNQQALKKEDWRKIVQLFIEQEKIENFAIAGFSIGARFAIATVELFQERVSKIILLAPDGIEINFWYRLATGTSFMRTAFRSTILNVKRLNVLIRFLRFLHLEDESLLRFAEFQLSTEEKRQRVYNSWIYFRHLNFDLKQLNTLINSNQIRILFILGNSDKVVRQEKIRRFAKTLRNCEFHLIDANHNNLLEKAIPKLLS